MKASDLFVKALENEGVEYIFGIPGEENLDLLESLKNSSIKLIVTRHEQAAGFMAATVGRLTGKAGVCLSTLGPGATNFATPASYAQLGAMPLFIITGQKPIKKSKQGLFQIVDVVGMMESLAKYSRQITHGNKIPSIIREAFRTAHEERRGVSHVEFPEDIAREETTSAVFQNGKYQKEIAEPESIKHAVEMIKKAKRPLLLIGSAGTRRDYTEIFRDFVDKTGLYFFTTQMGKGTVDERHERYLGTAALSAHDDVHCAVDRSDLIIAVGHDPIEKPPFLMENGDGREVIHINYFPAQVEEIYFPQHEVIGDIGHTLTELIKGLESAEWDFSYFQKVKEAMTYENTSSDRFPMSPKRIVADVRKVMPDDGIVTLDNGMYKIWFARHYQAHQRHTLLLDNALATMGAGLPSAIAAKLLNPDKKVITVCGDGGFMMNSQELETAKRLGLDLVVVILNDSGYGMIKWKQNDMGFANYGLEFGNPDFIKYAESYGATGHRVHETAEFAPLLQKCLDLGGLHLIELPIDYSENKKISSEELMKKVCPTD